MRPDGPRPEVVGRADGPEAPFPLRLSGPVIAGFGRGSKEASARVLFFSLGIPTANIPVEGLAVGGCEHVESGVYYGWAGLGWLPAGRSGERDDEGGQEPAGNTAEAAAAAAADEEEEEAEAEEEEEKRPAVYPMVMSIGWNPYYKNTVRSIEVHLLHSFRKAFYGAPLHLTILGFIRPEYDYVSKEGLIADIMTDIDVARRCLLREGYSKFKGEAWLLGGGERITG
ncbi:MAG: riboflavin kinase [Geoglossum simile]|nr:MAG: riboflavin kinase [Geoglossum simile]